MTEIKLTKRYPHSRTEDITDAFMRGYEQGKKDGLKVGKQIVLGAFETYITADRKTESDSEKPNNSTISKMEQVDKDINVRSKDEPYIDIETGILHWCGWKYRRIYEDEPQTKCYLRTSCDHYGDKQVCGRCREYNLYSHTKDEPQTDCPWK